jgi:hypothetical protein
MSIAPRCPKHPGESGAHCLSCYLDRPCEAERCENRATHSGIRRGSSPAIRGDWCNEHTSWDHPAFARND